MAGYGTLDIDTQALVLYLPVYETNHGYPDFSGGIGQGIQIPVADFVPLQSSVNPQLANSNNKTVNLITMRPVLRDFKLDTFITKCI